MIFWKIVVGVALFICSTVVVDFLIGFDVSMMIGGHDYAPEVLTKILDAIAGSLVVWGVLRNPVPRRMR